MARETNPNKLNAKGMSANMVAALDVAAARFDGAIVADRRTWGALWDRGLVDLLRGRSTGRYGNTVYNVIIGIYINDAGRAALAQIKEA